MSARDAVLRAAVIRVIAEQTGVALDEGAELVSVARLVAPLPVAIRSDAQLYLVPAAPDVELDVAAGNGELDQGAWIQPGAALARWRGAEWVIPPLTRRLLAALEPGIDGAAARLGDAAEVEAEWPRLYEIVPGIFKLPVRTPTLPPATHTGIYLIGHRDLVVIDPASPHDDERAALDQAIEALARRGRRVREIWLTHHHADHVGGAAHLRERLRVPVVAHARTAELLASRVPVDRTVADGDVLALAGEPARALRVIYTPGHAPGHICVFEEHTRFLVAGDMIAGTGTILVEPSEGDMALYLESLARIRALEPAALLPAHGPDIVAPGAPRAKIDEYIAHRLWREARVFDAVTRLGRATSSDLVPVAYSDVAPAVHPLAERSLVAHLVKLQRDGRVTRSGPWWSPAAAATAR